MGLGLKGRERGGGGVGDTQSYIDHLSCLWEQHLHVARKIMGKISQNTQEAWGREIIHKKPGAEKYYTLQTPFVGQDIKI